MKIIFNIILTFLIVSFTYAQIPEDCENSDSPMIFAPELAIKDNTYKGSFSDDYNTFYFFRRVSPNLEKYIPYQSSFKNGKWSEPEIISYYNEEFSYTYQLKISGTDKLIFLSNLKTKKDTSEHPNYNFWYVVKSKNKWGMPLEMENQKLIYNYNSQPCIADDGTIYFTSDTPDWSKIYSYKMEKIEGNYQEPKLFESVNNWRENKNWNVYEFCMAPDKSYMIITIQSKKENESTSADLYISYFKNEMWTKPEKLNSTINSSLTENFPYITQDGKYLMFTRAFSQFYIISTKQFLKE